MSIQSKSSSTMWGGRDRLQRKKDPELTLAQRANTIAGLVEDFTQININTPSTSGFAPRR